MTKGRLEVYKKFLIVKNRNFWKLGMDKPMWDEIKSYTVLPDPAFEIWIKYVLRGKAILGDEKY